MIKTNAILHIYLLSSSFRPNLIVPILKAQMIFSQIMQAPGPDFRMVEKSLDTDSLPMKKIVSKGDYSYFDNKDVGQQSLTTCPDL